MPVSEIEELGVCALAEAVRSGDLSAAEPTARALSLIATRNARVNAFAETRAWSPEEAVAAPQGPLRGVPVAVKDVFADLGRAPSAGSLVPARWLRGTAEVMRRLRNAGAIVVGYANLHEWTLGATSTVTATGPVRNPWAEDFIAGGSSGGSAAALACGMVPGAIGGDAGGSIRIPSACCGVVGFKPSHGVVPLAGSIGDGCGVDHAGPMARSVADVRALFEALTLRRWPSGWPEPPRVGVARRHFFELADDDVIAGLRPALDAVAAVASRVVEVEIAGAERARTAAGRILSSHVAARLAPEIRARAAQFAPTTLETLRRGAGLSPRERASAAAVRSASDAAWTDVFAAVDVVVTPTLARLPTLIEAPAATSRDAEISALALNAPMNLAGVPALSLPCGRSGRWTVSLTLTAGRGRDGLVLSLAEELEEALGRRFADRVAPPP